MALDQLANIAEIIGAVIVIVTLVFLSLQIRQNTSAIRATTIQAVWRVSHGGQSHSADFLSLL